MGALFIPSLALALATWSGGSKLFEVVYLALWYAGPGPLGVLTPLDFMGASNAALAAGMPLVYLAITPALLAIAVAGRWRRLRV